MSDLFSQPLTSVAALCGRRMVNGETRWLIVRTSTGKRWTFPKGHIEPTDRSPSAAAEREAWEEAGLRGRATGGALGRYLHPKKSGPVLTEAWLIEMIDWQPAAAEAGRAPDWVTGEIARQRLSQGRTRNETTPLWRVLEWAEERRVADGTSGGRAGDDVGGGGE
jgi:8-oxo-dGTP pyrophosphatase MutT (NUDIX family)